MKHNICSVHGTSCKLGKHTVFSRKDSCPEGLCKSGDSDRYLILCQISNTHILTHPLPFRIITPDCKGIHISHLVFGYLTAAIPFTINLHGRKINHRTDIFFSGKFKYISGAVNCSHNGIDRFSHHCSGSRYRSAVNNVVDSAIHFQTAHQITLYQFNILPVKQVSIDVMCFFRTSHQRQDMNIRLLQAVHAGKCTYHLRTDKAGRSGNQNGGTFQFLHGYVTVRNMFQILL